MDLEFGLADGSTTSVASLCWLTKRELSLQHLRKDVPTSGLSFVVACHFSVSHKHADAGVLAEQPNMHCHPQGLRKDVPTGAYLVTYFALGLVSIGIGLSRSGLLILGSITASRKLHR